MDEFETKLKLAEFQKILIDLYNISHGECQKNRKLTMEIGTSREKDLKAFISATLDCHVKYDLDSKLEEDIIVAGEKISIKHISKEFGKSSFKLKWTSDTKKAFKEKETILQCNNCINYLLVYIGPKTKTITISYIEKSVIKNCFELYGINSFKNNQGTNNRGIELSKIALEYILSKNKFRINFSFIGFQKSIDPIERRINYIQKKYFSS